MPLARPVATSRNAAFWSGNDEDVAFGNVFWTSCSAVEPWSDVIVLSDVFQAAIVAGRRVAGGRREDLRVRHVRPAEADRLPALRRRREADRDHVELLRHEARDQAVEVEVLDVELDPPLLGERLQEHDVVARRVALRVQVHLRLELERHADRQLRRDPSGCAGLPPSCRRTRPRRRRSPPRPARRRRSTSG